MLYPSGRPCMGGTWGAFLLMMVGFTSAQQFFTINSGLCTVDPAATNCIRSPYFGTSSYRNSLSCTITPTSLAIGSRMTATTFSTEAGWDILRLRNTAGAQVAFSGTTGPSNFVLGTGTITWASDGSESNYAGWRVCSLPPAPPPAPGLCTNTCFYASDGVCDDGGPGSEWTDCAYGIDCVDCGVRAFRPPPPPLAFPPPPPPYTTPPPPHFTIISGLCTTDPNANNCIRSPNFPLAYANLQTCTITPTSLAIGNRMTATTFATEAGWDILRMYNTAGAQVAFSGTTGPSNFVLGTGSITWVSDDSVPGAGWRVCVLYWPPPPPPPPPRAPPPPPPKSPPSHFLKLHTISQRSLYMSKVVFLSHTLRL